MEVMMFFWFIFSLVIGAFGADRNIGFWGAFLLSLLLSPLVGLIGVALSGRPQVISKENNISKLKDLADLRDRNVISEEEFNKQKGKLLS